MELAGRDPSSRAGWSGQRPRRVVLDGAWVRWDYLYTEGPFGPGKAEAVFGFPEIPLAPPVTEGRLALLDFIALADASPDAIRTFVTNWGPLQLCRHHLPATHWLNEGETAPRYGPRCLDVDGDPTYGKERIEDIRGWARMCRALLRIGLDLAADSTARGRTEDWSILGKGPTPADAREANERLSSSLNAWLALGLVWVQVDLLAEPRLRVTNEGVFGVLARELVRAVMNCSMAICTACGEPYEPSRRPRAGEDTYCKKDSCKAMARAEASKRSRRHGKAISERTER
jgi:hypothetical protein